MKVPRTSPHKKHAIITVLVLLIIASALVWWFVPKDHQNIPAAVDQPLNSSGDNMKQREKDAQKKEASLADRPQIPAPAREGTRVQVTPIVAGFNRSANGAELLVDGGVNEIIERGGVCLFVISWSGGELSQQTEAVNAPSSTSCKTARFAIDQLPVGTDLTIQVSYSSAKYTGTSTNGPSITKEQLQ